MLRDYFLIVWIIVWIHMASKSWWAQEGSPLLPFFVIVPWDCFHEDSNSRENFRDSLFQFVDHFPTWDLVFELVLPVGVIIICNKFLLIQAASHLVIVRWSSSFFTSAFWWSCICNCSYEATSSRKNRSLAKELSTGAVASVFLGFGSLFLLLACGVYVWFLLVTVPSKMQSKRGFSYEWCLFW